MSTTMTVRRFGALVTAATSYADSLLETADVLASQIADMPKREKSLATKAEAELREEVAVINEALEVLRSRFPKQASELARRADVEVTA